MANNTTITKKEERTTPTAADTAKRIENHKATATHLSDSSKHHQEAAKHLEAGNHDKAAQSTLIAHGHQSLADDKQKENIKHHALNM